MCITRQPQAAEKLRRVSWTVVAHGQFDLQHYARAERAYLEFRALGPGQGIPAAELDERIAAAVYRQAEAHLANGDVNARSLIFCALRPSRPVRLFVLLQPMMLQLCYSAGTLGGIYRCAEWFRRSFLTISLPMMRPKNWRWRIVKQASCVRGR